MDKLQTKDIIDHQRWLINNGFANDLLKDNLYLFGIYLHPGIREALVAINFPEKTVEYRIYTTKELYKDFYKYKRLQNSTSKWSMFRLKRLWRKHFENKTDPARLDIDVIINSHVKELCGHNWSTKVDFFPVNQYKKDTQLLQQDFDNSTDPSPDREPDG